MRNDFRTPSRAPTAFAKRLKALGVAAIYVFGSRAQGTAGPLSDFDFGVLLNDPYRVSEGSLEIYRTVYDVLSPLTHPETLDSDTIDIVFLDSPRVPLELKMHIVRYGKVIFDGNSSRRLNFESLIMLKNADFAPLRAEMRANLFARL